MSGQVEVNLDDALSQMKELVRTTPLSEADRQKQYTNIRAFRKLHQEYQRIDQENKELKQQLKQQNNG